MTLIISAITTSKIGIWNIPMRGQNFINNYYANMNNYKVGFVFSKGFLFKNYDILESIIKKNKKKKIIIIFCSALQLSTVKKNKKKFINFFKKYEMHFALELKKGKGTKFFNQVFEELNFFTKQKNINIKNITKYENLFKLYKKKII